MKFLVVFTCALAAASAGIIAPIHAPLVVSGPQHLPVIGPNGVPVDTIEVQHARAAHLAHKVEAHARNGDLSVVSHSAPVLAHASPILAHSAYAHHDLAGIHHLVRRGLIASSPLLIASSPQHLPVIGPNGVPVDTVEVQHARAAHLAHKVEAHARNGDLSVVAHSAHASLVGPVLAHSAVASPIVAHHAAFAHAIPAAYPTTLGLPAVTGNGIPLETPEVVAAKSNHFAAHAEALAHNSPIISQIAISAPIATVW